MRPVSPYDSDQVRAPALCFDRETGEPISPDELLTYAEALAQYHPHPESKFLNGDYLDSGVTQRRHILATGNEVIGKEADRWEEQYYTGPNVDAEIEYGSSHDDAERRRTHVVEACAHCSLRELALRAGMSHTHVWRLVTGPAEGSPRAWARLQRAVASLKAESAQPSPVTTDDS